MRLRKKSKFFSISAFVFILLIIINTGISKPKEVYVSSELKSIKDDNLVDVFIKLKDPGLDKSVKQDVKKQVFLAIQNKVESDFKKDKEFKLKKNFKYINGFSAKISKNALRKLERNPNVEAILIDFPIYLFLNDSVPLINASEFWNVNISGFNINGSGHTVCVIDSGVDYTRPALGGCNIVNFTKKGNNESFENESAHPYANDLDKIYKFNQTGFTQIAVHFVNLSMEPEWDFIKILDPNNNNNTIATYTGFMEDVWTPSVVGDTIFVKLETDVSGTDWGFKVDQIINGTANTTLNWSLCDKVIGGWDFSGSTAQFDKDNPFDDHGHGTHVAGIISSMNETYKGVAPGAKIVAVDIFNSSGEGANTTDLLAAMEFCIENKDRLNISVISMSLGGGIYSSACDSGPWPLLGWGPISSLVVEEAIANDIFVVAATGNDGSTAGISFPACLENITSVGSTEKDDSISSFSNRESILDVFAPGGYIMSTVPIGSCDLCDASGWDKLSGTSMATPHVAGAAVLMQNFKRLENGSILTPLQIRTALINTGIDIGGDGPRINLTGALEYIDDDPRINSFNFVNDTYYLVNDTFVNITTSEPIVNATLEVDAVNYTMNGSNTYFFYNITEQSEGEHNFSIFITDSTGNKETFGLYVLNVDYTKPDIDSMFNESYNETSHIIWFNATEAVNATIYYGNETGVYDYNSTNTTYSVLQNFTLTNLSLNTTYYYYLIFGDQAGNVNESSEHNFTTLLLAPIITLNSPENDTYYTSTVVVNVTTNEVASCNYSLSNNTNSSLSVNQVKHTTNIDFSDGTYNITILCADLYGQSTSIDVVNFSVDTTSPSLTLNYPNISLIINDLTVELNYTLNESTLDKVWYTKNYNSTNFYLTPSTNIGDNLEDITLSKPGKQVLIIYANDTLGNSASTEVIFYFNASFNLTDWTVYLNSTIPDTTSVQGFNSSYILPVNNISQTEEVILELNFTNITVWIFNFTALDAVWDYHFGAEDSDVNFESEINSIVGTEALDYVYIKNFTYFFNESNDYFGKVKLPFNDSSYDSFYYCPADDLYTCSPLDTCNSGYTASSSNGCYNNTRDNTYVYVPHFSAVFAANDTVSPNISITSPVNESNLTKSYLIDLVFTTNENSTCQYKFQDTSYTALGGVARTSFSTTFNRYTNSDHNLTINCTDGINIGVSEVNFRVNDTTDPSISEDISIDADDVSVDLTLNEPTNATVIVGSTVKTSTLFTTTKAFTFTSLNDGEYDYNITACDQLDNCGYEEGSVTVDTDNSTDDGGTANTGGSSDTTTKVTELFENPDKGLYTMDIPAAGIAFTQIIFTLKHDFDRDLQLSVEKRSLPSFLPGLDNEDYQYVKVDHYPAIDTNFSSVVIKFRVEKTWITNNKVNPSSITLYRYTNDKWNKLSTSKTSDDSSYIYYSANTPGLSYFGINGVVLEDTDDGSTDTTTDDDTSQPPTTGQVTQDQDTNSNTNQNETPTTKNNTWMWIIFTPLIIIGLIIGIGLIFIVQQRQVSVLSDNELKELDIYVEKCKASGIDSVKIRGVLLKVGWPEYVVDLVLHDVHVPEEEITKLVTYITLMKKKGYGHDQIRYNLKQVGWQEEVIEEAFKSVKPVN